MRDPDTALAGYLRAVGQPTRLWMVRTLSSAGEPLSARRWHTLRSAGDLTLGTIAYHARELFDAGLLVRDRQERRRGAIEQFYRLSEPGKRMAGVLDQLAGD